MTRSPCGVRRLAIVSLSLCVSLASSAPVAWRTDFEQARQEAQRTGKMLVVNMHASWCGPLAGFNRQPQIPRFSS